MSETTKGDLEGKAQAIGKLLGSGQLGGRIEMERRMLYQTGDKSEAVRKDWFLTYLTCVMLMNDKTAPLQQKLDAIQALRRPVTGSRPTYGGFRFVRTESKNTSDIAVA
jgi:hypothetical protein